MTRRTTLSAFLLAAAVAANADTHTAESCLAQGHWVKIKVNKEGIHQITPQQLRDWGFGNPEKVRVYGYGGTALALDRINAAPDDLQPTMSTTASDGRLLFYADADMRVDLRNPTATETYNLETGNIWRRNIYDSSGYYFLSDRDAPPAPGELPAPGSDSYAGTGAYIGHMHVTPVDIDLVSPLGKGSVYCEREFSARNPYTFSFSMPDRIMSETEGGPARTPVVVYTAYAAQGAGDISRRDLKHTLTGPAAEAVLRHTFGSPDRFSSCAYLIMNGSVSFENGEGDLSGELTVTPPDGGTAFTYYMDRHATVYPRLNRLPEGRAGMVMHYCYSETTRPIVIAGATPSQRLWDISNPAAVRPLQLRACADGTAALATMPQNFSNAAPGRLILFDTDAPHMQPEFCGTVAPQNIHGAPVPELAIITTRELEPYARQLAEAHERIDGISVGVFLNEQVLNEFSSGALTPVAYRRLARMFRDRDSGRFRHLLLLGPARWDHRGVVQAAATELIAIHECNVPAARAESTTAYAFDGYAGCLGDFSYIEAAAAEMDINVGRIPASNAAEAAGMVGHIIDYMENPPPAAAHMNPIFTSSSGDAYEHYLFCEEAAGLVENAAAGFVVKRIHRIAYPVVTGNYSETHRMLSNQLAEGRGLFCYMGHSANPKTLAGGLYNSDHAASMRYPVPPIAMFASCENYVVDSPSGLAAQMLAQRGGGAIGIIAACRSVYSHLNRILTLNFAGSYAAATPGTTLGDLYRNAHNRTIAADRTNPTYYNTKCYNLCGDPALRLSVPDTEIHFTSVGGGEPGTIAVQGRAPLTLEGYVAADDGTPDAAFNGTVDIIVYDTATEGSVQITDPAASKKPEITITNRTLAVATAVVKDGVWSASVFLPEFSNGGAPFGISADARDAASRRSAHGFINRLPTAGEPASADKTDPAAPEISTMYIDSPDFYDGTIVGSDFVLYADIIEPESGINLNKAPLAGASRVLLDGVALEVGIGNYLTRSTDSPDAAFAMPFSNMAEGRHSLELFVSNNLGEATARSVSFTVCNPAAAVISVGDTPARTEATFSIGHDLGPGASTTIIIDNSAGKTVRTLDNTSVWDLCDADGNPVPDGLYTAAALVRDGLRRTHASTVEFIVLHKPAQ